MKPYIILIIFLMNFVGTKTMHAQVQITRIQIATDTTEITRKLLLNMDNQRFHQWVNSVSQKAETESYRFDAPPLEQFFDSFNFKVNISEFNDTTDISIQLQRKSIADASKVLAKVSLAISSSRHSITQEDSIVQARNRKIKTANPSRGEGHPSDDISQEIEKQIETEIETQTRSLEGIDFVILNRETRDTLFQSIPKEGIYFITKKKAHKGTASTFNFNLGLLQMQNFAIPRTTVMRYNEMPELNNAKSLNIGFEALWGLNLYNGNVRLWYGISYDFYNYRFQNNAIRIDPNQSSFEYRFADANDPNETNPEKSKLVSEYIGIPVALSFENAKRGTSKLRFMIGVKGGYLMNAYTKVKYDDDRVTKNYDDFHLNELILQPFFRFQWDDWALFGNYSNTPISQNRIDPSLSGQKNMVIGISLVID